MMRTTLLAAIALALFAPTIYAQDIEALERSLEKARMDAPMTLKPFMAVTRPAKYYGDYEARGNTQYGRGEKLHFYAEPKNLVYPRNAAGVYEPAFDVDFEVRPPQGETLKQEKFMSMRLPTRSRVQDIYLNLTISLGSAPPGKYNIKFTVRDANSKKVASVDQDVTLK